MRQVERKFTRLGGIHAAIPSPHVAGRLQVQTDPQRVEAIERFLTTVPPQKHTRLTGSVTGSGVLKCAGEMTALTADESLLLLAVLMEN
ncbi:MAG: hypothetical protein A2W26_03560 [Acidobacteria bacterium RBG_16_64_8]|nr:MAG: hypothetical protein A2W26_03560 [Acidobacteria bacterium RBG_16_64_8]